MSNGNYQNGKLPASALMPIARGQLAKDNFCAASWNAMNVEARAKGCELLPTGSMSSYRTYAQQVYLWNEYRAGRGSLAATPGSSNHGWGLAVDLATPSMRAMLDHIGRHYGWAKEWSDAPSEWWHIRYRAGVWSGSDPGPSGSQLTPADVIGGEGGLASCVSAAGVMHVFAEATDHSIWCAWQGKGSTTWSGASAGQQIAGLSPFAPAPRR